MFVQARAGRIFVNDAGIAECPVVFVHSLAGSSAHWTAQLEHVRRTGAALAFDLRGHGRSDAPEDDEYGLEASADDLQAVLDALGIDRIVLVGHSMGGAVAALFAALHPDRVQGLMLVDPVGDQRLASDEMQAFLVALDTPYYDQVIGDYWKTIAGPAPAVHDLVMADLARTPRRAVLGMLRSLQRTNLTHALLSYTGPKLTVITPHNEFPFSLHHVDPSIRKVVLPDTGHWLQLDSPAAVNALLDEFTALAMAGR